MKYETTIGEREYSVEVLDESHVNLDGKTHQIDFDSISGQPLFSLLIDGKSYEAYVYPEGRTWQVLLFGRSYTVSVIDEREKRLRAASGVGVSAGVEFHLKAPMPGLLVDIPVGEGQEIQKGDVLVILESMKMQNELKSPRDGTVARVHVEVGESVEQHHTLVSVM